jgi:hypothetical protein
MKEIVYAYQRLTAMVKIAGANEVRMNNQHQIDNGLKVYLRMDSADGAGILPHS